MNLKFTGLAAVVKSFAQRVARARRGNMAMIFAIVLVPVLITGGAGIDLARAMAVRTKLYAAVDAAALAVASKSGINQSQAETLAQQYFNANYRLNSTFGTPANVTVNLVGQSVTVSTNNNMPTTLMGIAGFQNVNLTASSNVVWGQTKIWVGLALDNTGSMCQTNTNPNLSSCPTPAADSKIAALKLATHALLNKFQSVAASPGDVRVSLIPFAKTVNVGASNHAETWLDFTDWDANNSYGGAYGTCTINGTPNANYTTRSACLGSPAGTCSAGSNYDTQALCQGAGTCSISGNTTQSSCQSAGTCSVSGYNSQNSCQNAGTCNIPGNSSQNSCQNDRDYVCSLSGYSSQNSCQSAGTCNIAGKTTKSQCEAAVSASTCMINGVAYTDNNHNTKAKCEASTAGICSKPQFTTKATCQASNNPKGVWYVGVWTQTYGVWTAGVWSRQYGTWTATPGTWTSGAWTSTPGTWTANNVVWTPNHAVWNGCVRDRGNSNGPSSPAYDVVNTAPGNSAASKFSADTSSCSTSMMALGYDWGALSTKVDAMTASGSTNQPIGLVWAWHSLSTGAPLNAPSLPTNTTRYIIILSDGENTADRWYPSGGGGGSSHSQEVDDRMALVCANAKADNIIIWSVFVNIAGTAGNADSMKKCATGYTAGMSGNPDHYIEVTSTGDIGTAFDVISQQITNLRVAH